MTVVLEGGEWSVARPGHNLPPGKSWYPFYRRLGGLQSRSGRAENLVPTGIRSRIVQPLVSHYNDWATRPTGHQVGILVTTWELFSISYVWVSLQIQKHCEIKKKKRKIEEICWRKYLAIVVWRHQDDGDKRRQTAVIWTAYWMKLILLAALWPCNRLSL